MELQDKDLTVFNQIKECFKSGDEISISIIQRRFALGYNAAWRVMHYLEADLSLRIKQQQQQQQQQQQHRKKTI